MSSQSIHDCPGLRSSSERHTILTEKMILKTLLETASCTNGTNSFAFMCSPPPHHFVCFKHNPVKVIALLIIKIMIASIVICLKNFYFLLIHLPSCYQTVVEVTLELFYHTCSKRKFTIMVNGFFNVISFSHFTMVNACLVCCIHRKK